MSRSAFGPPRVAIVGAGVAGLAAARELGDHGWAPVVFDKGRGPGGRISSRRAEPFSFDHGAQYFTARDPRFLSEVQKAIAAGAVARWEARLVALGASGVRAVSGDEARYVGTPRMSSLARHLSEGVDVRCETRVASLRRLGDRWHLADDTSRDLGSFDRVLVTAPPAQASELIGESSPLGARAAAVRLRPCWAVLLGLSEPYGVEFDGAFCEDSSLSWVARNSSKPARPEAEAWVLHASPAWSEVAFDEDPTRVIERLAKELVRITGAPLPRRLFSAAHRWAYALPERETGAGALVDPANGLALAGDAYVRGRVEGAFLSGLGAAQELNAGKPSAGATGSG